VLQLSDEGMVATMEWIPDPYIRLVRHVTDLKQFRAVDDDVYNGLNNNHYIVKEIINARGDTDTREYLCRWRGFPSEFDSWVSSEDVLDKKLSEEADLKWIPTDQAQIADERVRRRKASAPQELLNAFSVDDVVLVEGLRGARHGVEPSIQLGVRQRSGKVKLGYYCVSGLPQIQRLLMEHKG
jgi:hypothetical protein